MVDKQHIPGRDVLAALNGAATAAGLQPFGSSGDDVGDNGAHLGADHPDDHHAHDAYGENDAENGRRLLDRHGRDLLYVPHRADPWHVWNGSCWPPDQHQTVAQLMERLMREAWAALALGYVPRHQLQGRARWLAHSLDTGSINAALRAASRHVSVMPEVFDTHDWLLPCANGKTYDLETGTVIDSLPEHYMTRCAPVAALEQLAPHPQWDAFMRLLFGEDDDLIAYIHWIIGLSLTGYTGEKTFWFWQGKTDAGKTTLLKFIEWLLGDFVYAIPLRALLKQRQDTGILHDIAGTQGMRFVYAEEFKPGDVLDSAWVKKLTGENTITADRKGEPNVTFASTAKLVIGTNDMPTLADVDTALRRRVRVVPFPNNIPSLLRARGRAVPSSDEVIAGLQVEGAAILHDLAQTIVAWNRGGRMSLVPKVVADASKQYLDEQDLLMDWLETCFEHTADGRMTPRRLELPLVEWYWSYLEQSGRTDTRALYQGFGDRLTSKGFTKRKTARGALFTGPALTLEARRVASEAAERAREVEERQRAYRGF